MNKILNKKINTMSAIVLISLALGLNSSADEFEHPSRSFGPTQVVDLTPLFQYWHREMTNYTHKGSSNSPVRPLASWKLIWGRVVEVKPYSFVIEATVCSGPRTGAKQERIFLWRAPVSEKEEWDAMVIERQMIWKEWHGTNYTLADRKMAGPAFSEAADPRGLLKWPFVPRDERGSPSGHRARKRLTGSL